MHLYPDRKPNNCGSVEGSERPAVDVREVDDAIHRINK